ncbi:uncharacterized protein [Magallana gigas]|uniref:Uncharacterized protein n=1 Tax=Magallana gigas TaxID=29159 RepID=A0A8W8JX71_MAGGI|nr:uncharacterized protein LOC117692474 isoform X1 [Crassostrea gigas]
MAGTKRAAPDFESHNLLTPPKLTHSDSDSSYKKDSSSPSSSDEDVPLHTSKWTRSLLDKLGVVIKETLPLQIINEWNLATLPQSVLKEMETTSLKTTLCLRNIDFHSLEEIWEITRYDKDLVRLLKPDDFESHSTLFGRCSFDDFLYALGCVLKVIEEKREILEWQYQLLFDKFLQMFGISSMHQPLMSTKEAKIMSRTVFSQPDLLCTTSNPRTDRPILFVCELTLDFHDCKVKKNQPVDETDDSPPSKKLRSKVSASSTASCKIPDHLLAQHVGELLVHMDESATSRAILGMTVERTYVRITSLHINEKILEKVKFADGTGSIHYDAESERPSFFYSKAMNYLKKEDRIELIQSLLHIKMMQRKFETEMK